jgi:hypothetical protein
MADLIRYFDSQWTLEQTERAFQAVQVEGYQLQRITSDTRAVGNEVLPVNRADFKSQPFGAEQTLLFVEVGSQDPELLRLQKQSEGWTFVCYSRIYVQGVLVWVMVLRR